MTDAAAPLLSTPLRAEHLLLGAKLVPFAGYEMPIQYSGIVREHTAVRTAAGLFDVSHMGELRVTGPSAVSFVNALVTNDLERVAVGQALYTCCCREDGGILDDLILYKFAADDVLIVCNASNHAKIVGHVMARAEGQGGVSVRDETSETALLALQGPRALDILAAAEPSLASLGQDLRTFHFTSRALGGVEVTVARTGYTGEDGVEIFCPNGAAVAIWTLLMAKGAAFGLLPVGLGARDTLRLEARLSLYGNELDEDIDPVSAGVGWTVKMSKPHFVGKEAIERRLESGPERTTVGFEMVGRGVGRHGYPVLDPAGTAVGVVTSGGPSPTLGRAIGLCRVPPTLAEVGTALSIDCRGKTIEAKVVKTPFYRRPR
jgi:aminomethyltransferase